MIAPDYIANRALTNVAQLKDLAQDKWVSVNTVASSHSCNLNPKSALESALVTEQQWNILRGEGFDGEA